MTHINKSTSIIFGIQNKVFKIENIMNEKLIVIEITRIKNIYIYSISFFKEYYHRSLLPSYLITNDKNEKLIV